LILNEEPETISELDQGLNSDFALALIKLEDPYKILGRNTNFS